MGDRAGPLFLCLLPQPPALPTPPAALCRYANPSDFEYFKSQVKRCVQDLRLEQYVVAIEDNFSDADLQARFAFMQSQGVHQVALWLQNLADPFPKPYFSYFASL